VRSWRRRRHHGGVASVRAGKDGVRATVRPGGDERTGEGGQACPGGPQEARWGEGQGQGQGGVGATVRVGGDDGATAIVQLQSSRRRRHRVGVASARMGRRTDIRLAVQGHREEDDGGRRACVLRGREVAGQGRGVREVSVTVRVGGNDGAMTMVRWRLSWRRRHHVGVASGGR
jgi:hypothetical protein